MKVLFLTISFLFSAIVYGQNLLEDAFTLRDDRQYQEAIDLLEQNLGDQNELNTIIFQDEIANLYGLIGNYDVAFRMKEDAVMAFQKIGVDSLIYNSLNGLVILYNNRQDYEKGHFYIRESLKYASNKKDYAMAISSLGIYYRHSDRLDSAEYFYLKGLELYPKDADSMFYCKTFNNLAILEKEKGDKAKALEHYKEAKRYADEMGVKTHAAAIAVNTTYVYYDLQEYKKAEQILNENEAEIMSEGMVLDKLNFDLIRYNIAEKLNNTSDALKFYKRYRGTQDSVNNLKLNTRIAEFETKYETAEKEHQIAVQEVALNKAKLQRQYLFFGLLGAIWFGVFGILYLWSRNRYERKLNEEKLYNLAIESMVSGQENERLRIAQDLHDSIGGLLTTIKLQFGVIQQKIKNWAHTGETDNLSLLIDKASAEVRRISHNMSPRALNLSGLNAAIGDLATEIKSTEKIDVTYEWFGGEIPEQDQIMVYRIIQESCNNALKYSQAEHLLIQVNVYDDSYNVQIADDGIGMEKLIETGMGIKNIRSRAALIKADLEIDTSTGEGVSILLTKAYGP